MSRYVLEAKAERADVAKVVVGWDRPLRTFFVQVFICGSTSGEGQPAVWHGTAPSEIPTPEAALGALAPYARIPGDLAEKLRDDMQSSAGISDGEAQRQMKRRILSPKYG